MYFCGNKCKQSSAQHHQKHCTSISQLQEQHREKIINSGTYFTTLTINESGAVTGLVGERCTVRCIVNNKPSKLLLDTGAQVSIINKHKLGSNFPDVPIQDISSILDRGDSLRVQWGDEENIPFVKGGYASKD